MFFKMVFIESLLEIYRNLLKLINKVKLLKHYNIKYLKTHTKPNYPTGLLSDQSLRSLKIWQSINAATESTMCFPMSTNQLQFIKGIINKLLNINILHKP